MTPTLSLSAFSCARSIWSSWDFWLATLAEQQKKLRTEKDVAARLLGLVRMDAGLGGTLSEIVARLLRMYSSPKAFVVSRESESPRISLGTMESKNDTAELQWVDSGLSGPAIYLSESRAATCYVRKRPGNGKSEFEAIGLDADGILLRDLDTGFLLRFRTGA